MMPECEQKKMTLTPLGKRAVVAMASGGAADTLSGGSAAGRPIP